jgi:putative membrane protein
MLHRITKPKNSLCTLGLCFLVSGTAVLAQTNTPPAPAPVSPTDDNRYPGGTAVPESKPILPNDTTGSVIPGSPQGSQLKSPSQEFGSLHKIQMINSAEIKVGQMAKEKATSTQVKQFADMLIKEHTQSKNNFAKLNFGAQTGAEVSADASQFQAELDNTAARLEAAKGDQFDTVFIDEMITGHQKAIDLAGQIKSEGQSQQIRDFVTEFNTMVSRHLDQVKEIQRGAVAH